MFFNFKKDRKKNNIDFLIVGLGNPTKEYENTRHNAGFMALDYIADRLNVNIKKNKFDALFADTKLNDKRIFLVKPQTYMNLSGESVFKFVSFYKIFIENIVVISDDISLPVGKIRIRRKGSHGGHNGLKNIINLLGSDNFPRIKIGVGAKPSDWNLADWVLSKFSNDELRIMDNGVKNSFNALKVITNEGVDKAMNEFN